ncbi:MAG: GTPase ObgE [Bacteriovoracaceae bacterium]|jgi:GTPase|nr:GTPase ObgE [Bacteriovoracaceae bacterium]
MRFIDEVKIIVSSGRGGNGCASFRREKFLEFGGPDGGDGGDGGSVFFEATKDFNTLVKFRGKKVFNAQHGTGGSGRQMHGKYGEDLIIPVPVGTIIRNHETSDILADLTHDGHKLKLASGGRGGLGNLNFKSSTNQAPRYAQEGGEGITLEIELELKLLADIALVGLPNAGKSTLISVVSAAKPKIADYPFTTLEPNLGVVALGDESYVLADIPGLIENAAEGKGLGIKFLKHIERTKAFVHLVDCSWCLEGEEFDAFTQYITIRDELGKFNEDMLNKKEIICLTKIDAMSEEEIKKVQDIFQVQLNKKVLPISSVSGRNIEELKSLMLRVIKES